MGTRGAIGYVADGKTVAVYNHFDSYPDHLGLEVAKALKSKLKTPELAAAVKAKVTGIGIIDTEVPPTPEQIARCEAAGTVDLKVGNQSTSDWYCLLRNAQGDVDAFLDGRIPYVENDEAFLLDSLFCEYAYLFNFDTGKLEFYKGFNKDRNAPGRYAALSARGEYAGVALALEFDFVNDLTPEKMVDAMNNACADA
jgi:hypothetical protein